MSTCFEAHLAVKGFSMGVSISKRAWNRQFVKPAAPRLRLHFPQWRFRGSVLVIVVLSVGALGEMYAGPFLEMTHWTLSAKSAFQRLLRRGPVADQPTPELWREAALGGTGLVSSAYLEEPRK